MNSNSIIPDSLVSILSESIPVAAFAAIVALAALSFNIKQRATERINNASNFDEKENFSRSEFFSKIGMASAIVLLIPYTLSVAGLFNAIANILILILGCVWIISTLISIFLL